MTLRIHNTWSGQKEDFVPLRAGEVGMYVCGVTVYDECHLGHGRAYVAFDVIARYLAFCGYRVNYVRNVTDVDDKIIEKARKEGVGVGEISQRYYEEFKTQMKALGLRDPDKEPRAMDHIAEMISLIGRLVEKGVAYAVGADVFFDVGKYPGYGGLSKRNADDLMAGARVEVDARKKSPLDFSLWKSVKPGEPFWESPWGNGRPGWHVECSAMSMKYLGETFDLHCGGQDLIFPHHENEIAQSGAVTGKPLARYWVHNGFVMFKSHKMSKSLGNVSTLAILFKQFGADAIKYFLLSRHYRSPVDFDALEMEEAKKILDKINNTLGLAQARLQEGDLGGFPQGPESRTIAAFREAMDDDFNTPRAIALMHELLGEIHAQLKSNGNTGALKRLVSELIVILDVLGVPYHALALAKVQSQKAMTPQEEASLLAKETLGDGDIVALIGARNAARDAKDFACADRIRNGLAQKGIVLRDEKGATTWVKATVKAS